MKTSPLLARLMVVMALLVLLVGASAADSLQLRDGRHLHGKYVGGTENMVAFIADGAVQSYAVSDVLVLTFGDNGSPASLDRFQPNSNSDAVPNAGSSPGLNIALPQPNPAVHKHPATKVTRKSVSTLHT